MAKPLALTLFVILSAAAADEDFTKLTTNTTAAAINSTRPTTASAVNSTIPTINSNITSTAINSPILTTANSKIPSAKTTATAVNTTIPSTNTNDVNSKIPTTNRTATAVISTIPTTKTTVNSTKPSRNTTGTNNSISPHELDTLLRVLRYSGYPLFSNAIDTSDIQFQILTGHATLADASSAAEEATPASFTIFAPRDHFLYTLDMASDADAYVAALRYHVIPSRRLTFAELRNLPSPYLDTLLPHYSILVGKSKSDDVFVTVDGVRVSAPNLYLGSRFAVHGLDGILLTGFNMYEDTLAEMRKGFFAPEKVEHFAPKSSRNSASAASPSRKAKIGGSSRVMRKQRKLQYRRIWRSNHSVRRSNDGGRGEDDF